MHSFIREATKDSAPLHVAGMVLQAITGVRAIPHVAKENIVNWNLREGKYVSVTSEVTGEYMHHFMGKLVDVVLPKIKDWKGVRGTSGDTSGNISFGLVPEEVGYFPEVESNYDSYVLSKNKKLRYQELTHHGQISSEDDPGLSHHDQDHSDRRPRRKVASDSVGYSLLWQAGELVHQRIAAG